MGIAKMLLGTFWLAVFWNLIFPFNAPLNSLLIFGPLALIGIHVLEIFIFAKLIRKVSNNIPKDVAWVIFFGVIRISELKKAELMAEQQSA